jgi:hypothetical protein
MLVAQWCFCDTLVQVNLVKNRSPLPVMAPVLYKAVLSLNYKRQKQKREKQIPLC